MLKITLVINIQDETKVRTPDYQPNQRLCYQVTLQTRPKWDLESFLNDILCSIDPEHGKESYSHHPHLNEKQEAHRSRDLAKFQ